MPIFPFDPDEKKRRRLALTPRINPDVATPLNPPDLPTPAPRPLPTSNGAPGGVAPPPIQPEPEAPELSRYSQVYNARAAHLEKTPGRFKSALLGAARDFGKGMATGGGLGAGLGAAAEGALTGAIAPRMRQEQDFNQRILPKMYERFAYEDQERAQHMADAKAAIEGAKSRAELANIGSQIKQREAEAALNQDKLKLEQNKPVTGRPGERGFRPNAQTGKYEEVFQVPERARPADEAAQIEAQLNAEQGTVEEQAQGSLRGRLEMLKKHLTPDHKRIIEGGATSSDTPATISEAWRQWQKIQDEERNSIRRVTGEKRKSEVSNRRLGRKGMPGRTSISQIEADSLLH